MSILSLRRLSARQICILTLSLAAALFVAAITPWRTSGQGGNQVTTVSAASFAPIVAPDSIVSAFGVRLATATVVANALPLPRTLAGTTVRVNGEAAQLFFVSPGQINFLIPAGTPAGTAGIVVTSGDGTVTNGTAQIAPVAPALFTANADGQGPVAGVLLRVKANGQQSFEPVAQFDSSQNRFVTRPIDFGEEGDQIFLILFLTGARQAVLSGVRVVIGGVEYSPLYAGVQGSFAGLDQINVALPRSFGGRGRISLLVKAAGYRASNAGEFEIGAGTTLSGNNAPLQIAGVSRDPALAGEEIEISGAGFAANPRENTVQIVGDDGVTAKADVLGVNANALRIRMPFGAGMGNLKVSRGQIEASVPIRVRTSVSGFIEQATQQSGGPIVRVPIPGARVRVTGKPETETVASADGSFVMPDLPPSNRTDFEILPPVSGSLNFPAKKFPLRVRANRDNQLPRGDEQTVISGVQFPVAPDDETAPSLILSDPSSAPNLTLTYLLPGRTPANLPAGHFSTRIAQLAPFGEPITPGARLSFPNADAIPAGAAAKLFKFDQTAGSATLGQFVEIGVATVTADGQRVETAANAITEGSYYFISVARPMAAINGRVVESDGRPVPRAIVQARGQSTFTDGFGGFVLRDVPVMKPTGDKVRVEASYQRPDGRVSRKDGAEIELTVGALATVKPDIALDPVTANFPPVIIAPTSLTISNGEPRDSDFIVSDPDSAQPVQVSLGGNAAPFFSLGSPSANLYRLRLLSSGSGNYSLTLTATDGGGASSMQTIAVSFPPVPAGSPIAYAQSVTTPEDTPKAITVSGFDLGNRALSFMIVTPPPRGSLSGAPPNVVYTPLRDFNGFDSFTFKTKAGNNESEVVSVGIAVSPANDAPVLSVPENPQVVNAGETLNLIVTATDVDGEQMLRFPSPTGLPPGATFAETSGTSRLLSWTPTVAQTGTYEVRVSVTDNGLPAKSDAKTVTIKVDAKWAKTAGPEGGSVTSLLKVGGALFAGTSGGVYRSDDNGKSWTPVNNGLTALALYVFTLLANGDSLFAGTAAGLYRSTDSGRSWTSINTGQPSLTIKALAVSGGSLFAGTGLFFGEGADGVYRSADNGRSWTRINNGLAGPALNVTALLPKGASLYVGTDGGGVYRSDNNGQNWTAVNTGLTGPALNVYALAVKGDSLFAGTFFGGIYRSDNNGQNWTGINDGLEGAARLVLSLLTNGDDLFAGTFGGGVYRLAGTGQSWTRINTGLLGPALYVSALQADGRNLLAGTSDAVYVSTDNGQSWKTSAAGIAAASVNGLLSGADGLYAASLGVHRSVNDGQIWTPLKNGLPASSVTTLLTNSNLLFVGIDGDGVYRSDDNGQNWMPVNQGLSGNAKFVRALLANGNRLFAGTADGVYRSDDNGQNWNSVNNGLNGLARNVYALLVKGNRLFAGTNGGVYRSDNDGQHWTEASNGLSSRALYVRKLVAKGNSMFAGTDGGGVYRSEDDGQIWQSANQGLPEFGLFVRALLADNNSLFLGTFLGTVYRSIDNGQTWTPFGSGLVSVSINSLAIRGTKLFAGTFADGVWLLADSNQSWTEINAGLTNKSVNALASSGDRLFAGTLGSGIFRFTDQDPNWRAAGFGLPPTASVQSLVTNGATLWAAAFGGGVYRSTDQGATWAAVNAGLSNPFVNELFLSGAALYAGTDGGVFRSLDGGSSWTAFNAGLTHPRVDSFTLTNGVLFAGTDGGGVFRLNADGVTWTQLNRGLTSQSVTALGVSGNVLYAGTAGGGICISQDGGENWMAVNNALPTNLNVFAFAVSGRKVYAGSIHGVFVTENEGQIWTQINAGLLNTFVTGLAVSGDQLFASTAGGGVFSSKIP